MESLEHPNDTVKNKDDRAGLKVFIPNGISKILSGDLYKSAVQIKPLLSFIVVNRNPQNLIVFLYVWI